MVFPGEMRVLLTNLGWSHAQGQDYWMHKKCVKDPVNQDYRSHGMTLREAYALEMGRSFLGGFSGKETSINTAH